MDRQICARLDFAFYGRRSNHVQKCDFGREIWQYHVQKHIFERDLICERKRQNLIWRISADPFNFNLGVYSHFHLTDFEMCL